MGGLSLLQYSFEGDSFLNGHFELKFMQLVCGFVCCTGYFVQLPFCRCIYHFQKFILILVVADILC